MLGSVLFFRDRHGFFVARLETEPAYFYFHGDKKEVTLSEMGRKIQEVSQHADTFVQILGQVDYNIMHCDDFTIQMHLR